MSWVITGTYKGAAVSDPDAQAYLRAVEAADNQGPLEQGVQQAVNQFVLGCKADGIWTAIKASCILAGARTLAGALVPLAGTAPTNTNFVSGDYSRKTGLKGDGSTKFLNSNRGCKDDPDSNAHYAVFLSSKSTSTNVEMYLGANQGAVANVIGGDTNGGAGGATGAFYMYLNSASGQQVDVNSENHIDNAFLGMRRNASNLMARYNGKEALNTAGFTSTANNRSLYIQARNNGSNSPELYSTARIAFYSIGESLSLALLDARVTTLINAIAAAIP